MEQKPASPRGGELRAFFEQAKAETASFDDFARVWRAERISAFCPGAAGLAATPSTPRRIWGALLTALADGASKEALAGGPCLWSPPCAYDLFHNTHGTFVSGFAIPKPFAIAVEAEGGGLSISITLFGEAAEWSGEVMEGLVRGLRRGLDGPKGRRGVEVRGRRLLRLAPPAAKTEARNRPV